MRSLIILLLMALPTVAAAQVLQSVDVIRKGRYVVASPDTATAHNSSEEALQRQLNLLLQGVPADSISISLPYYAIDPSYHPYQKIVNLLLYDFRWQLRQDTTLQGNVIAVQAASVADSVQLRYIMDQDTVARWLQGGALRDSIATTFSGTVKITATGYRGTYEHTEQDTINIQFLNSLEEL